MRKVDYIIFSDASTRLAGDSKRFASAFCAAVLNPETSQFVMADGILGNKTIVYSEGKAVLEGLRVVAQLKRPEDKIRVVVITDSALTKDVLTKYIGIWNLKNPDKWKKTDGSKVANQELYKVIKNEFIDNKKYQVEFIHVKAHLEGKKGIKTLEEHLAKNGVYFNTKTVEIVMGMNAMVDERAQELTIKMTKKKVGNKK